MLSAEQPEEHARSGVHIKARPSAASCDDEKPASASRRPRSMRAPPRSNSWSTSRATTVLCPTNVARRLSAAGRRRFRSRSVPSTAAIRLSLCSRHVLPASFSAATDDRCCNASLRWRLRLAPPLSSFAGCTASENRRNHETQGLLDIFGHIDQVLTMHARVCSRFHVLLVDG